MSSSFKRRGKKVASARPASAVAQTLTSSSSAPSKETTNTPLVVPSLSPISSIKPSSQRVKSLSSSILPGTKPWTNNLTLTSFGLREIDSFFFSSGGGSDSGGGQPLQTLVMLEEDRLADDLARALCRYWCAEGVAQQQVLLAGSLLPGVELSLQIFDEDDGYTGSHDNYEGSTPEELADFISSLPRNLHLDKFRARAKNKQSSAASRIGNVDGHATNNNNREAISAIIEEEEEEENDDDGDDDSNTEAQQTRDEGLINAWQYRKSVQDARSGIGNNGSSESASQGSSGVGDGIYCHSYDLSKRMLDQYASDNQNAHENPLVTNTNIIDCSQALSSSKTLNSAGKASMECQRQGMALFCCLWKHIQTTLSTHPNTVVRLFLHRLPVGQGSVAMPLLMSKIRKENLPVVVLATIRPWKWLSSMSSSPSNINNKLDTLASLRNATDTILSLDSFSSLRTPPPPEFSLLQGILTVRKCSSFTVSHYTDTVTWKRPLAERFGVKRDGRKVTVQLLHLPPEEYSKGGSSTGGVRSGGGNTVDKKEHHHNHVSGGSKAAGGCSSVGGGASLDF